MGRLRLKNRERIPEPKKYSLDDVDPVKFAEVNEMNLAHATKLLNVAKSLLPYSKPWTRMVHYNIDNSLSTDVIEFESLDEGLRFASYWYGAPMPGKGEELPTVPGDLIIAETIPITDLKIRMKMDSVHGGKRQVECRIIYISGERTNPKEPLFDKDGMEIVDQMECRINIVYSTHIGDRPRDVVAVAGVTKEGFIGVTPFINFRDKLSKEVDDWRGLLALSSAYNQMYMMLEIWYGIQLALTHPVIKDVFANPVEEKQNRDDLIRYRGSSSGKHKYIRKHYISKEHSIDTIIDEKIKELNSTPRKRPFTRKKLLWRVIGHYREQNGQQVWVKPYWKGLMRDMPNKTALLENEREVII